MVRYLLAAGVALLLSGCCCGPDDTIEENIVINEPSPYIGWFQPDTNTTWQWQLLGDVNTSYDVDLYDIDLFDNPTALIQSLKTSGKKVICYFSAGTFEDWRDDADQFPASVIGKALPEWDGENWLDIRTAAVRSIMEKRLDIAVSKGCDGVEPDNMDGYANNSGFSLTATDQLYYNRFIANAAHDRNLSVGLKNDVDQLAGLVDYYDFAVNEECFFYNECNAYTTFTDLNKAVFNAEYEEPYISDHTTLCTDSINMKFQTLILPWDLDDSFRIACRD